MRVGAGDEFAQEEMGLHLVAHTPEQTESSPIPAGILSRQTQVSPSERVTDYEPQRTTRLTRSGTRNLPGQCRSQ